MSQPINPFNPFNQKRNSKPSHLNLAQDPEPASQPALSTIIYSQQGVVRGIICQTKKKTKKKDRQHPDKKSKAPDSRSSFQRVTTGVFGGRCCEHIKTSASKLRIVQSGLAFVSEGVRLLYLLPDPKHTSFVVSYVYVHILFYACCKCDNKSVRAINQYS